MDSVILYYVLFGFFFFKTFAQKERFRKSQWLSVFSARKKVLTVRALIAFLEATRNPFVLSRFSDSITADKYKRLK